MNKQEREKKLEKYRGKKYRVSSRDGVWEVVTIDNYGDMIMQRESDSVVGGFSGHTITEIKPPRTAKEVLEYVAWKYMTEMSMTKKQEHTVLKAMEEYRNEPRT